MEKYRIVERHSMAELYSPAEAVFLSEIREVKCLYRMSYCSNYIHNNSVPLLFKIRK